MNNAVISGYTYVTDFKIAVLSSSQKILASESSTKSIVGLWMEYMDHSGMFALKRHWLKNEVVLWQLRQFNERVALSLVSEHVRQCRLTNLALELPPIDACVVSCNMPVLFSLEPAFDAVEMDVFDASSTLTDLEKRIFNIELRLPAKSALRNIFTLLRLMMIRFFYRGLIWARCRSLVIFNSILMLFSFLSLILSK